MTLEELKLMEALCHFMIAWAEREPDGPIPDVLRLCDPKQGNHD